MKIICDLCEKEKPAKKSGGIWVCISCRSKYPKAESSHCNDCFSARINLWNKTHADY